MKDFYQPTGPDLTDGQFQQAADDPAGMLSTGWGAATSAFDETMAGTAIRVTTTPGLGYHNLAGPGARPFFAPDAPGTQGPNGTALSEDQYKASPSYRPNVPYTPGMTDLRASALAAANDQKAVRDYYSSKRPITSFIGGLLGSAATPENYIPVLGEEVMGARLGKVAGETLAMSLNAGVNAMGTQLLTSGARTQLGDDTSWQSMMENAAFAAIAGAAIKGVSFAAKPLFGAISTRYNGKANVRPGVGETVFDPASKPLPDTGEHISTSVPQVPATPGTAEAQPLPDMHIAGSQESSANAEPAQGLPSVVNSPLRQFLPSELGVDANRFQFKSGGDAAGVTDRLQGVKNWDQIKAGVGIVWQDKEGKYWIADGHQRHGLASRLQDEGQAPIINGFVLREADGVTSQQARAIAAARNIAEGTGNAVDAAKVLRDAPRETMDLPPNSQLVKDAQGLSRLSPEAFRMVVNKKIDPAYASMVGHMEGNPDLHASMLGLLSKEKPSSKMEAESMIRDAQAAPQVQSTMTDLFGTTTETEILYKERASILASAARTIRNDKAAFNTLVRDEDLIEATGNRLNTTRNERRAQQEAMLLANLQAQARRVGPISDALAIAAKKLKGGDTQQSVMRDFLKTLRTGKAPKEALDAMQARVDRSHLTDPAGTVAHGMLDKIETVQSRQEAAQVLNDAVVSLAQDGEVSLSQNSQDLITKAQAAVNDAAQGPFKDMDSLYAAAPVWQKDLGDVGRDIAKGDDGVRFRDAGLKSRQTAEEKMDRKGYQSLHQLTDVVRGGFEIDKPEKVGPILDKLREKYNIEDYGWQKTPAGYLDRKVTVTFPDGMKGELQFWHPDMLKVKDDMGHDLYEKWRALPEGSPEAADLFLKMKDLYDGVTSKMGDEWKAEMAKSGFPPNLEVAPGDEKMPEFQRWFEGSKVVSDTGQPIVVYHGTGQSGFQRFNPGSYFTENADEASAYSFWKDQERRQKAIDKRPYVEGKAPELHGNTVPYDGTISDAKESWEANPSRGDVWATDNGVVRFHKDGPVEYLTDLVQDNKADVQGVGRDMAVKVKRGDARKAYRDQLVYRRQFIDRKYQNPKAPGVYPVLLSIKNPKKLGPFEGNRLGKRLGATQDQIDALIKKYRDEGYDGIETVSDEVAHMGHLMGVNEPVKQWIVFDPDQVRSVFDGGTATGKGGTLGNNLSNISRETTDPLSATSGERTFDQGAPSDKTAQELTVPATASDAMSAGRISQFTNWTKAAIDAPSREMVVDGPSSKPGATNPPTSQPLRFDSPRPEPKPDNLPAAKATIDADLKAPDDDVATLIAQAKEQGFDPETGLTDLENELDTLRTQGVITPHDDIAMAAASQTLDGAKAWEDVAQIARNCVL